MRGFFSSLFVVGKDTAKNLVEKTAELDERRRTEIRLKIDAIEKEYGTIDRAERWEVESYFKSNDMKSLAEYLKDKQGFKEAFQY
jgi:hypothetical protein